MSRKNTTAAIRQPSPGPSAEPANGPLVPAVDAVTKSSLKSDVSASLTLMLSQMRESARLELSELQLEIAETAISDILSRLRNLNDSFAGSSIAVKPALRRRSILLEGELRRLYLQLGMSEVAAAELAAEVLAETVPNGTSTSASCGGS